jgi:hypothetical protein
MRDITIALGTITVLGIIALLKVDTLETVTVLSYVVTALGSLATGHTLRK